MQWPNLMRCWLFVDGPKKRNKHNRKVITTASAVPNEAWIRKTSEALHAVVEDVFRQVVQLRPQSAHGAEENVSPPKDKVKEPAAYENDNQEKSRYTLGGREDATATIGHSTSGSQTATLSEGRKEVGEAGSSSTGG